MRLAAKAVPMGNNFLATLSKLVGGGAKPPALSLVQDEDSAPTPTIRKEVINKVTYLSAMRIFRDLAPEEIKMVEQSTVMTTARKGRLLYQPGETGEVLFLLKKGSVHLYRLSLEGRKFIVETIGPMTFFGQMPSVGQQMQDLFAEAAEECLVCALGRADVERLILAKPQVGLRMLEEVGHRMYEVEARLGDSAFKGIPARVATLLIKLSQDGAHLIQGMRHQDIADLLGIYRETVTSALDQLRKQKLIELGRLEIKILDVAHLREVAEEEILRKK